jgi:hypothetical protein
MAGVSGRAVRFLLVLTGEAEGWGSTKAEACPLCVAAELAYLQAI